MVQDKGRLSRRDVLKGFGVASALALINTPGTAQTTRTEAIATPRKIPDEKAKGTHRILSCNILLASPAQEGKPEAWENRRELTEKILRAQNSDIICMQEVLRPQAQDLQKAFPELASFGFPDPFMDQHAEGYHGVTKNVIMYSRSRYEMTSAGGYWLSETPLIAGSSSWDAARGRHANWVRLRDRATGKEFRVINTHFDHKGQQSREEAAKMINADSAQYAEEFPQLLAGDFNAGMANPAYSLLTEGGWTDSYTAVHGPEEPERTFHGLKGPDYVAKSNPGRIDFIFCRGKATPVAARIIRDNDNGRYPSDHYFVSADVQL